MTRASNQVVLLDDFTVVKEGDTVNSFKIQLIGRDGTPKDLTGKTVTWTMAGKKGVVLNKSAIIDLATDGEITLDIASGDVTGSGQMRVEIKVDDNGAIEKFPVHGYLQISISPTLENLDNEQVSYATIEYFNEINNEIYSTLTVADELWEVV